VKAFIEQLNTLEKEAEKTCFGDDGPPYCDDDGKLPCTVCTARAVLNEAAELFESAIKRMEQI